MAEDGGPVHREGQQPPAQQVVQQQLHIGCILNPNFLVNQMKMWKHIYKEPMIG